MNQNKLNQPWYVFLDEGGNFDFSKTGTRFSTMTAVVTRREFAWYAGLLKAKYDLLEDGRETEYFHATEDKQNVRDRFFHELVPSLPQFQIHSVIIEKCKTHPVNQSVEAFYPMTLGWLLRYVLTGIIYAGGENQEVLILTDRIPVNKKRQTVEKSVKSTLARSAPEKPFYRILHHDSKSSMGLQVADYCNWAIYKKWTDNDLRSYDLIKSSIRSEFEVFRYGRIKYY